MSKDGFLKKSLILIFSNLLTGILGFTFSIILSRKLGAEGMGLYGLIMPIYDLFICLICGGIITAISKVSAEYYSKGDYNNLNKTIEAIFLFDLIWAITVVVFVFFNSSFISAYIIKDIRTAHAIKVLCPAMIFIALSSILKGYFYGISKVKIPAFIDICEKTFRIIIILIIFKFFILKGLNDTVTAAYITLCIGEAISLILLYLCYKIYKKNMNTNIKRRDSRSQLIFNVLIVSLPLCLNGFLTTILSSISTLLLPRRLVSAGFDYSNALSMIGKFNGMSMSIVLFPIVIINSISIVLIPDLSEKLSNKKFWEVENRIVKVLDISIILGLATLISCALLSKELGIMFFNRDDLGNYIKFAAISCPFVFPSVITFSILNGIGKQGIILKNSLLVSLEQIFILYLLAGLKDINIYGYGITLIITSITLLFLNFIEIKKHLNIEISINKLFIFLLIFILTFLTLGILNNLLQIHYINIKSLLIILSSFFILFSLEFLLSKNKIIQ